MSARTERALVIAGTLASLILGLLFVFVRAPHPWGWEGIDFYYDFAKTLAQTGALPTADRVPGYLLFLAAFYRSFGDHPWVPLTAQVVLNAAVPFMVFRLGTLLIDRRTGAVAALLVGVLSFNTVYASTQISDSLCTDLFVAALLCTAQGQQRGGRGWFVGAGLLFGAAAQCRPNVIIFAPAAAVIVAGWPLSRRRIVDALIVAGLAGAAAVPWTVRNYRLTGELLPAGTHGGIQLWYGTLQTGAYRTMGFQDNPGAIQEAWPFEWSSVAGRPMSISAFHPRCSARPRTMPDLVYWTDRAPARTRVPPSPRDERGGWSYALPGLEAPTVIYYEFDGEPAKPAVAFLTGDYLHDPDAHGDLLDVFDVARLAQHVVWRTPVRFAERLDADGDGQLSEHDLRAAVAALLGGEQAPGVAPLAILTSVADRGDRAVLTFADRSRLEVPRTFADKYTDLTFSRGLSGALAVHARPIGDLRLLTPSGHPVAVNRCPAIASRFNAGFERRDVSEMHRYMALAMDNIRRDPAAFLAAWAYRVFRVFVVYGAGSEQTVQRFPGAPVVYLGARLASFTYLALFVGGVIICARRRRLPMLLLAPPVVIAVTIAPYLTNMRYSMTAQACVLIFAAVALLAAWDRLASRAPG